MRLRTMLALLLICGGTQGYAGSVDSFSIYFPTGVTVLNDAQKHRIDSQIYNIIIASASIHVTGFADEPGTAARNKQIAMQRAASVQQYLLAFGLRKDQISCRGMGVKRKSGNDASERRVDVIVGYNTPAAAIELQPKPNAIKRLSNMKANETLELQNLLFAGGMDILLPEAAPVLYELCDVMEANPKLKIRIEGHVCCSRNNESDRHSMKDEDYQLSKDRARAVYNYLVDHQISADRLSYEGYGFTRPKFFPERSEEDSRRNRRVEVRVVSNK